MIEDKKIKYFNNLSRINDTPIMVNLILFHSNG